MDTLDFSVENAVGWVRFSRPEIRNAVALEPASQAAGFAAPEPAAQVVAILGRRKPAFVGLGSSKG